MVGSLRSWEGRSGNIGHDLPRPVPPSQVLLRASAYHP